MSRAAHKRAAYAQYLASRRGCHRRDVAWKIGVMQRAEFDRLAHGHPRRKISLPRIAFLDGGKGAAP